MGRPCGAVLSAFFSLLASVAALTPSAANAGGASGAFTVTASYSAACAISSTNGGGGNYLAFQPGATEFVITDAIRYRCSNALSHTLDFDCGQHYDGSSRRVQMTGSGNFLRYQLYRNGAPTQVVGSCTGGHSWSLSGTGTTQNRNVRVRLLGGQAGGASGNYTDTIGITIAW